MPNAQRASISDLAALQRAPHHSVTNFLDYAAQDPDFKFMAALNDRQFNLAEPGQPAERVRGMQVSADFFAPSQ